MSDLKVNFGGLSTAAADIQSGASHIESKLNDMDSSLQPLRANWSGEAAGSYEAARAKWTAAITDMKALLAEIGRAVATSNDDYQATERANAARW
ncbi:WXG100 family type VII secretion target [Cellulomonas palmilytica]|uniref:WXG100 family type VII secretion target n=1 Tax=Cellulomonas palmilytica TaxID=2608402 RepID=UPI001F198A7C|nr:WXG100 family type VII secretion target [Cellulomonas palmilytica]UJP39874.1 WXG100 family type VII secretion target [Cellulomonas palmilytica]UJP39876.1 WXG100 family type VII secretion target [Cellulomonas palmilytica]